MYYIENEGHDLGRRNLLTATKDTILDGETCLQKQKTRSWTDKLVNSNKRLDLGRTNLLTATKDTILDGQTC